MPFYDLAHSATFYDDAELLRTVTLRREDPADAIGNMALGVSCLDLRESRGRLHGLHALCIRLTQSKSGHTC
jgi:hypothetical protein